MLTPKRFVHITLAALFAFNSLWTRAEITLIGQGELPGDTKDESKLSGPLEDSVTFREQPGGLSSRIASSDRGVFQRIATFPVFLNTEEGTEIAAEIVSASEDGRLLIYTDSPTGNLGFVDIADPREPKPSGVLEMSGEPTSVAVAGPYALAAVNTSQSFADPSGELVVVDILNRSIVRRIDLGGQPDSIAVSPDKRYAVIAIENERDEDAGDGRPPQSPPGFVVIVDLQGSPPEWGTRKVDLVGIPALFPDDPEPEYVAINNRNIAAVTLQENNHVVLVHVPTGEILKHWGAGAVSLRHVDVSENDLIELEGELDEALREPDAVTWISPFRLVTTDEGDLDGGSRGFTIFNRDGEIRFAAGNALEHLVTRTRPQHAHNQAPRPHPSLCSLG